MAEPVRNQLTSGPELWKPYMREQIPGLFGLTFSTAIWNTGFVLVHRHMFLLVTLEKEDLHADFRYQDHFLDANTLQWQSQNRTSRDSNVGQALRTHGEESILVHLFVRQGKRVHGDSAPFVYCGEVDFVDWEHDKPITIRWKLRTGVPDSLRPQFRIDR